MKRIFNKLNENIIIINNKGDILFCNEVLLEKLGYKQEDIIQNNINNILYNIEDIDCIKKEENIDLLFYRKTKDIVKFNCDIIIDFFEEKEVIFILCKEISKSYTIEDLDNLLDSIPIGLWIKNIDGKYLYSNRYLASLANKEKENMIGNYDIDNFKDEYAHLYKEVDEEVINTKKPRLLEEAIIVNGISKEFESYKAPILGENEDVIYTVGATRDISLRKKIEKQVFNNHNQVSTLNNILNRSNRDIKGLLENGCYELLKYLSIDGISIWLYDKDKKELKSYIRRGYSVVSQHEGIIKLGKDTIEWEIFNNMSDGLRDINEVSHIDICKKMENDGVKYIGTYKIKLRDDIIGILTIYYKYDNKPPEYDQSNFIKAICGQMAILIKNLKLTNEIKIENKKRSNTERELALFLETAVDLVGVIDEDGYFKKANSKWSEVLGWTEEELININLKNLLHPEDMKKVLSVKDFKKGSKFRKNVKYRYLNKNGKYIWLHIGSKYVEEENHFLVTGRDITKEMYVEEQTKKLEKAIEIESMKNEFFSNISHEFKTPLNIILGSMQLLNQSIYKNSITTEKLINHISTIKQNSYRLLRLVNNLIDISKIETGYYELQLSNNNIVNIIEDITLSVVNYVECKNINLIFDTDTECEILACDPDKIERVMLNLLSNAIKYTGEYGEIIVSLKSDGKKVIVSVKDNGTGIPKDKIGIIFDRFGQVNDALIKRREGSGIGLSLVKSLVEMHGGSIRVESELNIGSEFIFEIPVSLIEDEEVTILDKNLRDSQIEKCNIEFSDIYNI
ncbi:ATP-binding protein [Romboutsia sp. MSSM.1001216sp_RTP31141st1_G3_RTP31141_220114]